MDIGYAYSRNEEMPVCFRQGLPNGVARLEPCRGKEFHSAKMFGPLLPYWRREVSNPLPDWMDQKIWPQISGMMLNDAYFKLMWHARELTGKFNGPIAELIQTGYLAFQTVAIRRLCDGGRNVISLRRALMGAKAESLAPNDQIDKLLDKLDSCDRVIDLVNDHVAHTANPARSPNVSDSTCPWADLFKAQEAICRVAISFDRDILRRKVAINIIPEQQGDIMEDLRLWVPQDVINKLYAFWHAHNKAVNAWRR